MLDGEVFVAVGDELEFEVLQERIHPAKSRVDMLSEKTPAGFVAFDLLALGDESYVDRPLSERRAALEKALGHLGGDGPCYLTRTTSDPAEAERWFEQFEGAGLDGVVAKPLDAALRPRTAGRCSRSSTRARPTSWSPATASTRTPRPSGRCSAACCSVSTPTASCSTSASLRRSPRPGGPS